MSQSGLSSLYKNKPIVLWLEDLLAREYLREIWQDPDIALLIAGRNDAVHGVVQDARADGHANVFGFRDCDFIEPNESRWLKRESRLAVFVPAAHEIENYLLDFSGLAQLDKNLNPRERTKQDIEARAERFARESLWWMVVRSTIAEVRKQITHKFPEHPLWSERKTYVASQEGAEKRLGDLLLSSEWSTNLKAWIPGLNTAWIQGRIAHYEAELEQALRTGDWRMRWSGKEIFAELAGHIAVDIKSPSLSLAKGLGRWQRENGAVPEGLLILRASLRARGGIGPWPTTPTESQL